LLAVAFSGRPLYRWQSIQPVLPAFLVDHSSKRFDECLPGRYFRARFPSVEFDGEIRHA
jgi:hypothetical protein